MKSRPIESRRLFVLGLGLLAVSLTVARPVPRVLAAEKAGDASHQVIACYFHRTVRCPTCQRISAYIEEAVKAEFKAELQDGSVKLVMMDFQDEKNEKYAQAYRITGPMLVLMDVHNGKVTAWKSAPKVWSLLGDKDEFFRYVQNEIRGYLEVKRTASR